MIDPERQITPPASTHWATAGGVIHTTSCGNGLQNLRGAIEPTYEFLQSPLAGNGRPSVPVQTQVLRHAAIRAEARHFGAYCGWALSRAIRAQACACCAHFNAFADKLSGNVKNIPIAAKVIFFIRYAPKNCSRFRDLRHILWS
jgi:hypothetical protein